MKLLSALSSAALLAFLSLAPAARAQDAAALPGAEPAPAPAPAPSPAAAPAATPTPPAEEPALPAPAVAAVPAAGTGSLEIVTDVPGADAFVDGNRVGKTPLRVDGLTAGTHRVSIGREGGAPLQRDVVVTGGQVARVDAIIAGGPARTAPGSLGEGNANAVPAAPAQTSKSPFSLPGRDFFSTFLDQPWAWAAAGVSFVLLVSAALLWSFSGPSSIPVVGSYLSGLGTVNGTVWTVVRVGVFAAAVVVGLLALGLFIYPSLPFARNFPLPSVSMLLDRGKKPADAPPPAAAAPAPGTPAPQQGQPAPQQQPAPQ
jgi:hypothetical protein